MDASSGNYFIYCGTAIIVGFICGLIAGGICQGKGRDFGEGFLYGLILGIFGIIIAAVLPENRTGLEQEQLAGGLLRKCPFCAETIKAEAQVCRYCGKDVSDTILVYLKFKKKDWDVITRIIESVCQSRGMEWIKWGKSTIDPIRTSTNQVRSSAKIVSVTFYWKQWLVIVNILQEYCQTRGEGWVTWAESVSKSPAFATTH
jgi:uncharacterized membrane protein YeaQ/YmgE (transglycosylase-associated protein family)